jgi:hypothetical protein
MSTLFPSSQDDNSTLPNPSSNSFTNGPSLSTGQTNQNDAIKALEAKVGINSSAVTTSLDYIVNHLTGSSVGLGNVNNTSDASKPVSTAQSAAITSAVNAAVASVMQLVFPIGSVYTSTSVSTNPNTVLGFGTWVAIGGQVLAGYATGDINFGTPGAAVGASGHFHWQTVGSDGGAIYAENGGSGSGQTRVLSGLSNGRVGSSSTTNNLREDGTYLSSSIQPSLTVYMWQRTA